MEIFSTTEEKTIVSSKLDRSLCVRVLLLSDTHGGHRDIALDSAHDIDVLIHCGDITKYGEPSHLSDFNDWLGTDPIVSKIPHKVCVLGNHEDAVHIELKHRVKIDWAVALGNASALLDGSTYRIQLPVADAFTAARGSDAPDFHTHSAVEEHKEEEETDGGGTDNHSFSLCIYGIPFLKSEERMRRELAKVPMDTDILVTHSPPKAVLCTDAMGSSALSDGLFARIESGQLPRLAMHCFGHCHESRGAQLKTFQRKDHVSMTSSTCDCESSASGCVHIDTQKLWFVNASNVNNDRRIVHKPIVAEFSRHSTVDTLASEWNATLVSHL